jgi:hypothetical protein
MLICVFLLPIGMRRCIKFPITNGEPRGWIYHPDRRAPAAGASRARSAASRECRGTQDRRAARHFTSLLPTLRLADARSARLDTLRRLHSHGILVVEPDYDLTVRASRTAWEDEDGANVLQDDGGGSPSACLHS